MKNVNGNFTVQDLLLALHGIPLESEVIITDGRGGLLKIGEYEGKPFLSGGSFHGMLIHAKPMKKEEIDRSFDREEYDNERDFRKHVNWFLRD